MAFRIGDPRGRGGLIPGVLSLTLEEGVTEEQLSKLLSQYAPIRLTNFLSEISVARVRVPGDQELFWSQKLAEEHDEIIAAERECHAQLM